VILLVAGLQVLLFGFLGSQIVQVRRELYRTQKNMKTIARSLESRRDSHAEESPARRLETHSILNGTPEQSGVV